MKKMSIREQRGLVIAATCQLIDQGDRKFLVPSQTVPAKNYLVDFMESTCNCPDNDNGAENGFKCKHLWAVIYKMRRDEGFEVPVPDMKSTSFAEKKTYKQNWPAYNLAQTTEKHRFRELLRDLCQCVEPFSRKAAGRNAVPASDALFAVTYKVYCTVSTRRFISDLKDALAQGYLTKTIHYNSICAYLQSPELTPRLHSLIEKSSRPLNQVETLFAVDSTGFGTPRFRRWIDEKERKRTGKDWVKAHVMCCVRTNVVTAVKIESRSAGDAPQFKHLLDKTARNFTIGEVSADKAYLTAEIFDAIVDAGGRPFIPFKSSTTGDVGGEFQKAFHYYGLHRDEYMEHYHKRNNIESTFSAIKRKFGWYVRGRTDTSMVNEVLCKILCFNITRLIHSQCELGIEPDFWGDKDLPGKESPS